MRRKGFTLVELLVVIGIIALLISILLPALSSARRQAMTIKCASNLRQCYTALMLYSDAYSGYGVPPRAGGGYPGINGGSPQVPSTDAQAGIPIPYYYNGVWYGCSTNPNNPSTGPYAKPWNNSAVWWMEFLAKFLGNSKGGQGDTADLGGTITGNNGLTAAQAEGVAHNAVFWCPAWQAAVTSNNSQPLYVGYSMNYMVSVTPNHPLSPSASPSNFLNGSPPTFNTTTSLQLSSKEWFNVELDSSQQNYVNTRSGKWCKVSQITMKDQRCFLADSGGLLLECWQAPNQGTSATPTFVPPPQGVMEPFSPSGVYSGSGATSPDGQNAFDCYRHGVYPGLVAFNGGTAYAPVGGKVAYNILYWDGHVLTSTDRRDAYRSVRMRYPN